MKNKIILVTGGAGYIGSVTVKRLLDKGNYSVVVIDNLSKGSKKLIDPRAKFYQGDLTDKSFLQKVFSENKFDSVIHFAAYKSVEESMQNVQKYSDNIIGSINLLNQMVYSKVNKIIFSSTAAVYGNSNEIINEESQTNPANYYGVTKLMVEGILKWYKKIHNINYIIFRYFNVAGDELGYIDPHAENVFPIIMEVIKGIRKEFIIFGDDYKTRDGTAIRDYIDVRDIAEAHILGIESEYTGIINLGNQQGFSVKELVDAFRQISKVNFKAKIGPRRPGDVGFVVASNKKAKEILGWTPKYKLSDMIKTTCLQSSPA